MKKRYIAPHAFEVNVEANEMLASSIGKGDEELTPDQAWTNSDKRGEWGNLWAK